MCPYGCSHTEQASSDPLSKNGKFRLKDVEQSQEIKKYSDSQAMISYYSKKYPEEDRIDEQREFLEEMKQNDDVEEVSLGRPIVEKVPLQ